MLLSLFKKLFKLIVGSPDFTPGQREAAKRKFEELLRALRPDEISSDGREVKVKWGGKF
jgi:hypothetical protein